MYYYKNTPGLGIEYEVHVPAYFALLLNNNSDVEDFRLQSNVQEFGNLDDVLVDIRTKNGEELYFAFQLKHKQNENKKLLPSNFEAKGDFNLEKYCKAFKNLKEENKKYHFILYTNKSFGDGDKKETTKFELVPSHRCSGQKFFDTSSDGVNIYKCLIKDETEAKAEYEEFFARFTIYTKQINFEKLDKSRIMEILKYRELFLKYIDLFRKWHRGIFTNKIIDKKTLNIHLVDIFLSPYLLNSNLFSSSQDENSNLYLFKAAVAEFDLVLIEESKDLLDTKDTDSEDFGNHSMECLLQLGKDSKILDRTVRKLDTHSKQKLLHYFFGKPLVIRFDETSRNLVYDTTKLYNVVENKIKFVLVGEQIDSRSFPQQLNVFKNLQDLKQRNENLYREIIRKCRISVQRRNISLEELIDRFEEISDSIRPKEIFRMLKNDFLVGEEKEELPENYVSRTVSTVLVNLRTICDHCLKSNDLIIINFGGKLKTYKDFLQNKGITAIRIQDGLDRINGDDTPNKNQGLLLTTDEEFSMEQFNSICQKNRKRNLHYFRIFKGDDLLLVMSSKNVFKTGTKLSKIQVPEEEILRVFTNPINIICSQPGMGKSTLLKYLRNECSSEFWTLGVDLKAHNYFLKEKHTINEVLSYFLKIEEHQEGTFLQKLKTAFLEQRKIVIFFDGLDEIQNQGVNNVLGYIKQLSLMGFRIWVSSRENLQLKFEDYFNIFVIEINELNEEQQRKYIQTRLRVKYKDHEIDVIVSKIFTNANVANNRQIIGVPLQLHIITQMFLDDSDLFQNLNQDTFVLTKIYRIFFEGRYRYSLNKLECENLHLTMNNLEDYLEKYQVAALQSLFDEDIFDKLNLDLLLGRHRRFLEEIKTNKDPLGIIVGVNNKDKAVFEHFTFAEFFACEFLLHNFTKAQILKEQLFSERYQNLFLIFNLMIAENSPLELSVIHKDTEQLRKLLEGGSSLVGKQSRNLLHVAASIGKKHPVLKLFKDYMIKDNIIKAFESDSSDFKEVLDILLKQKLNPFEADQLFEIDCLEYALASGSLYVVEAILEKYGIPSDFGETLRRYYDDANIAYYSLRFGYPKLLSAVKKNVWLSNIFCSSLDYGSLHQCVLRFAVMQECANKRDIINVLLSKNDKKTSPVVSIFRKIFQNRNKSRDNNILSKLLRFATIESNLQFVDFLIKKGANVNFKGEYEQTALFFAIEQENFEMISLLLARGADVNTRNHELKTPLHHATENGNLKLMELLLKRGADINAKKQDGKYVLESAARYGHLEAFNLLIRNGARFNQVSLYDAAVGGNVRLLDMLLKNGADINEKNSRGQTALHKAVINGQFDAVKFLLDSGADVNIVTNEGDTILHYAVFHIYRNYALNLKLIGLLLEKSEIVSLLKVPNKNKTTPLHLIVYRGRVAIVELLLEKEIDLDSIDSEDHDGYSLHFARKNGRLQGDLLLNITQLISKKQSDEIKYYNHQEVFRFLSSINCCTYDKIE